MTGVTEEQGASVVFVTQVVEAMKLDVGEEEGQVITASVRTGKEDALVVATQVVSLRISWSKTRDPLTLPEVEGSGRDDRDGEN